MELIEVVEQVFGECERVTCKWRGCDEPATFPLYDWCELHGGEDCLLPLLAIDTVGYCIHCNTKCATWIEHPYGGTGFYRGLEQTPENYVQVTPPGPHSPLHLRCMRDWLAGRAPDAARGAYARRGGADAGQQGVDAGQPPCYDEV